jgi:hypothetical protein
MAACAAAFVSIAATAPALAHHAFSAEFDAKKQVSILSDLQKYLAEKQYCVTSPGLATQFTLAWPAVKNYLTYQGDSRAINSFYYTWWLDENEAPLKKS